MNPDCGLKTRDWEEVTPALRNMVAAAPRRCASATGERTGQGRLPPARCSIAGGGCAQAALPVLHPALLQAAPTEQRTAGLRQGLECEHRLQRVPLKAVVAVERL
ncbi:MAG: hypothetical protein U5L11_16700 [Arhodomonas sp.]|nr:hypothetical protein [Arhodomonas sp.]